MLHEPAVELGKDNSAEKKAQLGVILFWLYLVVYAGFVIIGTLAPSILGMEMLNVNLAIVYGMGLIALAAIMGLIYNHFCTKLEDLMNKEENS